MNGILVNSSFKLSATSLLAESETS